MILTLLCRNIQSAQRLSWTLLFLKTKQKLQTSSTLKNHTTFSSSLPMSTNNNIWTAGCEKAHYYFWSFYFHRGWNKMNDLVHLNPTNMLHIHLISSVNPVLRFFCRPYGPLLLCVQEPLADPRRSSGEFDSWLGVMLDIYSTAYNETPVWLILHRSEVTGALWCDSGIKCQWVFNLSDSAARCCRIRSRGV